MLSHDIVSDALELGYVSCGIIGVDEVSDYADRLDERIERTPENAEKYSALYPFARLRTTHPWAESIIVCVRHYGKYAIPNHLEGLVAKYYLTDGRRDELSPDYQASVAFEKHMESMGLKVETERKFGITALRWAAYKAGLGIIRRNNFFYTDCGSWIYLEAWLVDKKMALKQTCSQKPCPPNCNRCISACPTKSLREPYTMSRASCISCLTTWDGDDLVNEPNGGLMGSWIYGCDICQDVCPFNAKKWHSSVEYPQLREISELISLDKIITMDYDTLLKIIQPKFWYIGKERIWKWKVNALNAIRNNYSKKYDAVIKAARYDDNEQVRKTAYWVGQVVQIEWEL
jgi:epoxyqueuosine reductase